MGFELHDPVALLRSLCALPRETGWLEFKQNSFNAETVGQYVSGLANSAMLETRDFAFLIWGVEDLTHDIVGTRVRLEEEKKGAEPFLVWLAKLVEPRITLEVKSFLVDDKHIEMLCINPGYIQPVSFQSRDYIRIDSSLKELRDYPERARSLWQITSSYSFEKSIIIHHAKSSEILGQFNVSKLLEMMKIERRTDQNVIDVLEQRGLIKSNMQGGYEVFALLALACSVSLNLYSLTENKGIRILTYKGVDKLDNLDDTEGQRGYAASFSAMLSHIMARIPSEEVTQRGVRKRVYKIPEEAIREFLANTLVHQDFTLRGSRPTVEIYVDRIRFINPDAPLIPANRFIDMPSTTRNERLSDLMRHAGLCELRGSGVDRAIREIERAILPPPLFTQDENSTSVTVFMPKSFANMAPAERVRACFQHAQLLHGRNEAISNGSLRARFGLRDGQISQVSNVIREAQDQGLIKPLDPDQGNRNARYIPAYA